MICFQENSSYNLGITNCDLIISIISENKLMKGIALRKHCQHEKTAASVLLKLFISSNE